MRQGGEALCILDMGTKLAQKRDGWQGLVNVVVNCPVP